MSELRRQPLIRVDDPGRPTAAAGRLLVRRRRPSGQGRPASRLFGRSGRIWAGLVAVSILSLLLASTDLLRPGESVDRAVTDALTGPGTEWADSAARAAEVLGSVSGYRALWVPTVLALIWFARWRHLVVYLTTLSVVAVVAQALFGDASLPRAVRSTLTGSTQGYVVPTWPVTVFSAVATATVYVLLPGGRLRRLAFTGVAGLVLALSLARVHLGLDYLSGDLASALVGSGVVALAVALFAPEADFPVVYWRQNRAHLRLDDQRRARIADAVAEQLGVLLTEVKPYRLAGSAGSTPCRLGVAGGPAPFLFGKLYAATHVRSDRWYKFLRLLLYGRLEDEGPFASVRRLVEHEDYMLRLFRDQGLRVPRPYGVVEVEPGREYLLVTELVPDAEEVLAAEVDDAVVDDALRQVRLMWDAGVAHRDIKPSNVLLQGRRIYLIDLAFGELRPSSWREAVDLANMMLTLALRAGTARVYDRAVRIFDPHEVAEAFAASGSVTIPRQLRRLMAAGGSDLVAGFRALAPHHPPIAIQRWSVRRVRLALLTVAIVAAAFVLLVANLRAGQLL
jgi:hypothetical protein